MTSKKLTMNTNDQINREVDKTLASLDHIHKAVTDPFFYSRLEARLNHIKDQATRPFSWKIAATVALAVTINTFVWFNVWKESAYTGEVASLDSFAEEYNLELMDIYD